MSKLRLREFKGISPRHRNSAWKLGWAGPRMKARLGLGVWAQWLLGYKSPRGGILEQSQLL
jgi:hypothetical protein